MARTIDRGLDELRALALQMGSLCEAILSKALLALRTRSRELAEEVQRDDLAIDRLDVQIDEAVLRLLATQTPVAQDLREIVATREVATELERVGDLARNVARSAERLAERRRVEIPAELARLAEASSALLAEALRCFASLDSDAARAVVRAHDDVDRDEALLIRRALTEIRERPELSPQEVDFIFVARNLERVADHATHIAEDVVLIAEATNLKHGAKLARGVGRSPP